MAKVIKQIDINEALEITRKGGKVFVITASNKPTIKNFSSLSVGAVFNEKTDCILVVFEEVANEN